MGKKIDRYKIIRFRLPIVKLEHITLFEITKAPTSQILYFGPIMGEFYIWIMVHIGAKREVQNYALIDDNTIIDLSGYLMHYKGTVILESGFSYHLFHLTKD